MYRNTAHFTSHNIAPKKSSTPPIEDEKDEYDAEISRVLAEKRQQIDDEVAKFKATKDREFRDFEKDLLRKRRRRQKAAAAAADKEAATSTPELEKKPTALSLLGMLNESNKHINGSLASTRKTTAIQDQSAKAVVSLSQPTLSVDKLNIKGETTPPPTFANNSPLDLRRQRSRSPPNDSSSLTPPQDRTNRPRGQSSAQSQSTTLTPTHDHTSDSIAGIFSPTFLPLLDSNFSERPKSVRSESFSHPTGDSASSASRSISISPVLRKDRAATVPVLGSNSLPSALRTSSVNGIDGLEPNGKRRRKHVKFQLKDSAIVEPSSSYEEGVSPINEGDLTFDEEAIDGVVHDGENGSIKNSQDRSDPPRDDDDHAGYRFGTKPLRSPQLPPREQQWNDRAKRVSDKLSPRSSSPSTRTTSMHTNGEVSLPIPLPRTQDDPENTDEGSSGFFELDEELHSPSPHLSPKYNASFVDDDLEDQVASQQLSDGRLNAIDDKDEAEQIFGADGKISQSALNEQFHKDINERHTRRQSREIERQRVKDQLRDTYEYGSSVPIDIVRPSGSWVGSFGH